jgi:hypothetical protein
MAISLITLRIITLSIIILNIITLSIINFSTMSFSISTVGLMTLSTTTPNKAIKMRTQHDIQSSSTEWLAVCSLCWVTFFTISVVILSDIMLGVVILNACYAEYFIFQFFTAMLTVCTVFTPCVVLLNVVLLNVVARGIKLTA